jgi:hypothetical protein
MRQNKNQVVGLQLISLHGIQRDRKDTNAVHQGYREPGSCSIGVQHDGSKTTGGGESCYKKRNDPLRRSTRV